MLGSISDRLLYDIFPGHRINTQSIKERIYENCNPTRF